MTKQITNMFYKSFKAIINSTKLRKKKISYIKTQKLKNLNIQLKLQLISYTKFSQIFKHLSIHQNYKFKSKFISILF